MLLYGCFTADLNVLCEANDFEGNEGEQFFASLLLYC
jgi:hypothetical protein